MLMHATEPLLTFADLRLDRSRHRVWRGERLIPLSPMAFRLLAYFMERPEHVVGRDQLIRDVWGDNAGIEARTVDAHIRLLRRSLCEGGETDLIRTVRSVGYSLDVPVSRSRVLAALSLPVLMEHLGCFEVALVLFA